MVLSGAGISAESGLSTFRDSGGLWEGYDVYQVATPEAWRKNPELVLEFYNQRRRQLLECEPNEAHFYLAELETRYEVVVITQNVDDLHERGGSTRVLHLHGELRKAKSEKNHNLIVPLESSELVLGDLGPDGHQLRPHVVWFGEPVPMMDEAIVWVKKADHLLIVGTSLLVYPAAQLVDFVKSTCRISIIDPKADEMNLPAGIVKISKSATQGVKELKY